MPPRFPQPSIATTGRTSWPVAVRGADLDACAVCHKYNPGDSRPPGLYGACSCEFTLGYKLVNPIVALIYPATTVARDSITLTGVPGDFGAAEKFCFSPSVDEDSEISIARSMQQLQGPKSVVATTLWTGQRLMLVSVFFSWCCFHVHHFSSQYRDLHEKNGTKTQNGSIDLFAYFGLLFTIS